MFLSRYQDRPSTLKVDHQISNGDRKGTVYSLHEFDITVWEDGEVTACRKYYAKSDPQSTFPNMTVYDGSINLPIDDLVEFILGRIRPEELAEGLMDDDEARAALVYKMAERFSSPTFIDGDRREFLTKVQQQIYAEAVGRAIERLEKAEASHRARDDYFRWKAVETGLYRNLYEMHEEALFQLRESGVLDDEGVRQRKSLLIHPDRLDADIKEGRDPVVKESAGPQWHESRDYWRNKLAEFFPEPQTSEAEEDA